VSFLSQWQRLYYCSGINNQESMMARIVCTQRLDAVGPCEPVTRDGATVGAVLDALAAEYPRLGSYVLDDQRQVRKHVAIFVDGTLIPRASAMAFPVTADTDIHIIQALSGG
jgi:molybdopterin synthase sulfur carrier subunit